MLLFSSKPLEGTTQDVDIKTLAHRCLWMGSVLPSGGVVAGDISSDQVKDCVSYVLVYTCEENLLVLVLVCFFFSFLF